MAATALPALLLLLLLAAQANCQAFNSSILTSGLVSNFTTFAIITFPPCKYTGQTATLNIFLSNGATRTETFTVPPCRLRREAIFISDTNNGNTIVRNVGYKIDNLVANKSYTATYTITPTDKSNNISFSTLPSTNYAAIPDTMARSGGMVVITVLLSIAMVILIVGLIVTIVLGGKSS